MAAYDFEYALYLLRQAVDYAESEHDFVPLRKLVGEVQLSAEALEAISDRVTLPAGQKVLTVTLERVACGALATNEAAQLIQRWFAAGELPVQQTEAIPAYQFA